MVRVQDNDVLHWRDLNGEPLSFRILCMPPGEDIVVIDINDPKAWPRYFSREEITEALESGAAQRLAQEPFFGLLCPVTGTGDERRNEFPNGILKRHSEIRDNAWRIISPLVADGFPLSLMAPQNRAAAIAERVEACGCARNTVIKYLRRYWQRGQVPNALLPDYCNCGAPGKRRQPGRAKLGRPRLAGSGGRNVTDQDIGIFRLAIKRFVEKEGHSFRVAYELMLDRFYAEVPATATLAAVRKPTDECPSFRQFESWYHRLLRSPETVKAKEGETAFGRKHRSTTSGSKTNALGPGSVYIIDSTPADIYLRSSRTGDIVGRPVLYLVIDLFTAMIAGFYIGFLNASMEAARLALFNAFRRKPEWAAEMGLKLSEEEWPVNGLCQSLWIDGGELKGPIAENLIGTLISRMAQMPPYRPDLKGDVESFFNKLKQGLISQLPGASTSPRHRGDRDVRLDATLTIEEFRSLVLDFVLFHNSCYDMRRYPLTQEMVHHGVQPTPLSLWNWAVSNSTGRLRSLDEDVIRLHLLPGDEASVTPSGLLYHGLYYDSGKSEHREWYERARIGGRWKVPIAFHPNDRSVIYLRSQATSKVVQFSLTPRSAGYAGCSFEEYEVDRVKRAAVQARNANEVGARRAQLDHHIEQAIAEAQERTALIRVPGKSKAAQVRSISERRSKEKEDERIGNTWIDLGTKAETSASLNSAEPPDGADAPKRQRKLSAYWSAIKGG